MKRDTDTDLMESFRKASRTYSDMSILMHEAIARKAGLSGTDHKYLGFLIERGPMTAGELGALTGLTSGAITGVIDRLEKKKLVKRQFLKDDRRKVIIVPDTKNTMKMMKPLFTPLQRKTRKLLSSFTHKEVLIIEKYFRSASNVMNDMIQKLNKK